MAKYRHQCAHGGPRILYWENPDLLVVWPTVFASTTWHGSHLGSRHRTLSASCSPSPTIVYSSSDLRLIRKPQPKQSLDSEVWGHLGDLGIRKRYRSTSGGWKLSVNSPIGNHVPCPTTGLPSPIELSPAPSNSTSNDLIIILSSSTRPSPPMPAKTPKRPL